MSARMACARMTALCNPFDSSSVDGRRSWGTPGRNKLAHGGKAFCDAHQRKE